MNDKEFYVIPDTYKKANIPNTFIIDKCECKIIDCEDFPNVRISINNSKEFDVYINLQKDLSGFMKIYVWEKLSKICEQNNIDFVSAKKELMLANNNKFLHVSKENISESVKNLLSYDDGEEVLKYHDFCKVSNTCIDSTNDLWIRFTGNMLNRVWIKIDDLCEKHKVDKYSTKEKFMNIIKDLEENNKKRGSDVCEENTIVKKVFNFSKRIKEMF